MAMPKSRGKMTGFWVVDICLRRDGEFAENWDLIDVLHRMRSQKRLCARAVGQTAVMKRHS